VMLPVVTKSAMAIWLKQTPTTRAVSQRIFMVFPLV